MIPEKTTEDTENTEGKRAEARQLGIKNEEFCDFFVFCGYLPNLRLSASSAVHLLSITINFSPFSLQPLTFSLSPSLRSWRALRESILHPVHPVYP